MSALGWQDAVAALIALVALVWLIVRRVRKARGGATPACEGCEGCATDAPPLARGESLLLSIEDPARNRGVSAGER